MTMAAMAAPEAPRPGWVTRIDRIWMLAPFKKALARHEREQRLLEQLDACIEQLFRDPRHPGLNLETLRSPRRQLLSARITQSHRLILTPLARTEVGLLYLGDHDDAYRWVERNREDIPKMLDKVAEVHRGQGVAAGPVPLPAIDEDEPLVLRSAEQFKEMVEQGIARYLTWLDESQQTLVQLRTPGVLLVKGGAGTGKTAVAIQRAIRLAQQPALGELAPRTILFLCYNRVLASVVEQLMATLCNAPPERLGIEVRTVHRWCGDFLQAAGEAMPRIDEEACRREVGRAFGRLAPEQRQALAGLDTRFVDEEIEQVIKHNGLATKEQYLQFNRQGRGVALRQAARAAIWEVHERAQAACRARGIARYCDLPLLALARVEQLREARRTAPAGEADQPAEAARSGEGPLAVPQYRAIVIDEAQLIRGRAGSVPEVPQYRAIVIDEAQDLTPVMVRLAKRLLADSRGSLTVFADPAQAIYPSGWHWAQAALGVRGGSTHWLRKSYRTTREIFALARPLLEQHEDLAEELEQLEPPLRQGKRPVLVMAPSESALRQALVQRVQEALATWPAGQIGVLAATWRALEALEPALRAAGVPCRLLRPGETGVKVDTPAVKLLSIASAKGLDFPVVLIWGPHRRDLGGPRKATAVETRRTLYVALTRAGAELTIGVITGQQHPLVDELEVEQYELQRYAQEASPAPEARQPHEAPEAQA